MSTTTSPASPNAVPGAIARQHFLNHLVTQASKAAEGSPIELPALRDRALTAIRDQAFPSRRDEAWRFTDLDGLLSHSFQAVDADSPATSENISATAQTEFRTHLQTIDDGYRLATINGIYSQEFSQGDKDTLPDGVVVAPLSELMSRADFRSELDLTLSARLGQVDGNSELFTALNTAGFTDVLVVWIPADMVIEAPIYLLRAAQDDRVSHLRSLIIAGRHARVTVVESFWGQGNGPRFNTSVTECWLADGAQLAHIRLQDESTCTFHIGKTAVAQAQNSRYECTAIDLGASVSRHHLEIYQQGPQTETHLYGLSAIRGEQLSDTHSLVNMVHPHGQATQLQKNIADEQAHCVFNGRVNVARAAQLTDAAQLNRNLMLSNQARIDTKPELDIVADNVKCAHGATVSQLQAEEVFYLQSRGVSAQQAQRLLLYGFAMEIIDHVPVRPLRDALSDRLTQWSVQ